MKKRKELCHTCRRVYICQRRRGTQRETSKRDRSHAIIMNIESVTREPESRSHRCRRRRRRCRCRRRRLDLIRGHSRGGAAGPRTPEMSLSAKDALSSALVNHERTSPRRGYARLQPAASLDRGVDPSANIPAMLPSDKKTRLFFPQ